MEKGKLKIFFGYSAGVGKTYTMLKVAQEIKKQGMDVIIGYYEPHDRPATLAMAEGLEMLPLKEISYKGIILNEFDVDAAIKRKPQLILVDELAHTNAEGSKNRKRYLDVEELLNNGIDVYTTVNVQHIEGLHDTVDSITAIDVNERVPDEIFDYADEVALIDIEPSELIERMKEGKVYKKNRATIALENFFNENNLSTLRELSMRRSADRIEKQFHNGERKTEILVLISPSPSSQKNIRVAARTAEAYHCKFSAMYVETNGTVSDEAAANLKKHMNLVRDMGGSLIVKYSDDVVETVADYVRLAGVTNLIIGKTWQSVGKKVGLEDKFIAKLPNIELIIVPDNQRFASPKHPIKDFLSRLFYHSKLMQKYKTANRTLDTVTLLAQSVADNSDDTATEIKVAKILARAFKRSCTVITEDSSAVISLNGENVSFFDEKNEQAVAEWSKKNNKAAGRGTDTLRNAKAIYFPISANDKCICIVAFACLSTKMMVTDKIIFNQLSPLLKLFFI